MKKGLRGPLFFSLNFDLKTEKYMAAITASMVAELRGKTDAPMMECKKALTEAEGDMGKAEELLRVKLGSKAGKAASRITAEGVVVSFIEGSTGALLEVNCETDFVTKNDSFLALAKAAAELIAKERSVAAAKAAEDAAVAVAAGKPVQSDEIVAKRIEGGVQKYLKEVSLFNQSFVKNDKQTVEQMLKATGTTVKAFTLFVVGEGIEKKVDDFAAEVAAQVAAAKAAA